MEEKEGGLLSGSAEAKQLSINLLFMTRAAASVGYTELPLAFQKNRLSWVPSVLCLAPSSLACPHTQHRQRTSDLINPNHPWNGGMFQKDSLQLCLASKERAGCCWCCIQPPEWPPQIHLHRTWTSVLRPNIHKLTHTCRSGSHQCPWPHTALNCYPDLLNGYYLTSFLTNSAKTSVRSQATHWL